MPAVNFEHTLEAGKTYAFEMHGTASVVTGIDTTMQNVEIDVAKSKWLRAAAM
jgi:hypothetical protein